VRAPPPPPPLATGVTPLLKSPRAPPKRLQKAVDAHQAQEKPST
jgi:hypothetical protein